MWTLEGATARWQSEHLRLRLDVGCPDRGLGEIYWCGRPLHPWRLSGVVALSSSDQRPVLEGAYVRGQDVVATYAQTALSPVRTAVYWRIGSLPGVKEGVVVETIVSAQTELLDSDPRVEISCELTGRDWHLLSTPEAEGLSEPLEVDARQPRALQVPPEGAAVLLRAPDIGCTFSQVLPGADWVDSQITCTADGVDSRVAHVYFAARLEKGVLRRTRVATLLTPCGDDVAQLRTFWTALRTAAPPLTA